MEWSHPEGPIMPCPRVATAVLRRRASVVDELCRDSRPPPRQSQRGDTSR